MEANPLNTRSESAHRTRFEDFTAAQRFFAKGLMRVSGTNSVEDARAADWRFDGRYNARWRDPESTNYQIFTDKVIPKEGEPTTTVEKTEDSTERRCTICHQPITYVNLIGVGDQIVPTGSDCTAKLLRFKQTGEIVAENPRKEIWDEQSEILLEDVGESEKDAMENQGERRITKRKIIASMMSWLIDHHGDEGVPENIRESIDTYNNIGMLASNESARELAAYYRSVRKFLPQEILKDPDVEGLEHHPHHEWLHKIVGKGVVQEDVPQLKRIIEKGRELETQRANVRYEEWRQREEKARQEREQARMERVQARESVENKRKESMELLRGLESKGTISRHVFEHINFAADVCLAKTAEGKKGLTRSFEEDQKIPRFYEIGKNDVVYLYELDQMPMHSYGDKAKWFVVIGEGEPEQVKLYPRSLVKEVAKSVNKKEIPWEKEPVSMKAAELAPEATIIRFSCAQIVVSYVTNEPVVLLKEGSMPMKQFLKEYK